MGLAWGRRRFRGIGGSIGRDWPIVAVGLAERFIGSPRIRLNVVGMVRSLLVIFVVCRY